jgi:hypothetical protein
MAAAEEQPSARFMCEFVVENAFILDKKTQHKILECVLKSTPSCAADNYRGAEIDLDKVSTLCLGTLQKVYDIVQKRRIEMSTKLIS